MRSMRPTPPLPRYTEVELNICFAQRGLYFSHFQCVPTQNSKDLEKSTISCGP